MKKYIILALLLISMVAVRGQANNNLIMKLSAEKTEFLLGEPVVVYLSLTNTGNEPVQVVNDVEPELDLYTYYITGPDGSKKRFGAMFVVDRGDRITLQRNETFRGTARIFFGAKGYTFTKPGEYRVSASYGDAISQDLRLKILAPRNASETEQAKLILEHEQVGAFLMLEGGDELDDAHKQMAILNQQYPNGLLTQYVRYAQAKNYSVPARNFVTKKPRDADLPRAIEILEEIKEKEIQMFYRSKVFKTLSTNLSKTGKQTEARKVLEEFQLILDKHKNLKPYFIDEIQQELNKLK